MKQKTWKDITSEDAMWFLLGALIGFIAGQSWFAFLS